MSWPIVVIGDVKKLDWFFRISIFVPVVYKWLKSCAKKAHFPYPIEILFWIYAAVLFLIFFFWYLYRLWPIATSKTSSLTEWIPLRTILLYQRSFFIIPKVPSACIERFIRNSAPWILSRFLITSWCIDDRFSLSLAIPPSFKCIFDYLHIFLCIRRNKYMYALKSFL